MVDEAGTKGRKPPPEVDEGVEVSFMWRMLAKNATRVRDDFAVSAIALYDQSPMTPRRTTEGRLRLSHIDQEGQVHMVDVSQKPPTVREAVARGFVTLSPATLRLIRTGRIAKGDPLQAARLAGILAAKRTAELIPLCHPLAISACDIALRPRRHGYEIEARVRTTGPTGVEMEALTAVAVAALTIYDMVKAVDRAVVVGDIRLMEKRGGRSGEWRRSG